jgi:hypothetical protein
VEAYGVADMAANLLTVLAPWVGRNLSETLIAFGFFDRVKVLPLQVLDQRHNCRKLSSMSRLIAGSHSIRLAQRHEIALRHDLVSIRAPG